MNENQTLFMTIISHLFQVSDGSPLLCNFIEIILRHGCSPVNLLYIFRTPSPEKTSVWLLLVFTTYLQREIRQSINIRKIM